MLMCIPESSMDDTCLRVKPHLVGHDSLQGPRHVDRCLCCALHNSWGRPPHSRHGGMACASAGVHQLSAGAGRLLLLRAGALRVGSLSCCLRRGRRGTPQVIRQSWAGRRCVGVGRRGLAECLRASRTLGTPLFLCPGESWSVKGQAIPVSLLTAGVRDLGPSSQPQNLRSPVPHGREGTCG